MTNNKNQLYKNINTRIKYFYKLDYINMLTDLLIALSISLFSWLASMIWVVTLARKCSKVDRRCGSSRRSWAHRLCTSAALLILYWEFILNKREIKQVNWLAFSCYFKNLAITVLNRTIWVGDSDIYTHWPRKCAHTYKHNRSVNISQLHVKNTQDQSFLIVVWRNCHKTDLDEQN